MKPPITLYSTHLLEWASTKEPVEHIGKSVIFFNGKRIGKMPYLAICKDMDSGEFLLQYCNDEWESFGVSSHASVEEAKIVAERDYRNISKQWIETGTTEEEAQAELNEIYKGQFCSFCGKRFDKIKKLLFTTEKAAICDGCIVEFYNEIKEKKEDDINKNDDTA